MKPTNFRESNGKHQNIPTLRFRTPKGETISCWQASLWERIIFLFTGRIWLAVISNNQPMPKNYFTVRKKELIRRRKDISKKAIDEAGKLVKLGAVIAFVFMSLQVSAQYSKPITSNDSSKLYLWGRPEYPKADTIPCVMQIVKDWDNFAPEWTQGYYVKNYYTFYGDLPGLVGEYRGDFLLADKKTKVPYTVISIIQKPKK